MKTWRVQRTAGLTLIELLVVVVIILILVAVLFPFGQSAIKSAKRSKSIQHLRTIGSALHLYAGEHNGRLPEGAFRPTLNGSTVRYWFNALDYYCGGKDYLPESWRTVERPAWQNDPMKIFPEPVLDGGFSVNVGYGWNHSYFGYTSSWYPDRLGWGSRLSEIEEPARTVIVGTNTDNTEQALNHVMIYPQATAARRYDGKGLYLHLDGHVEAYTPEEVMKDNQYLFRKIKPQL